MKKYQVIQAVLYRLKTGCQWRELPMKQFFRAKYSWKSVFHHFRKWCKNGSWQRIWRYLLKKYKYKLDLSSIQLDGTHTPAKRGGQAVAYQGRKKSNTSNLLMMADNQGIPIACSDVISGNHNDVYKIKQKTEKMFKQIRTSGIATEGLFMNADAGFDTRELRSWCSKNEIIANIAANKRNGQQQEYLFDKKLYDRRFVIERTNAWVDTFKALLVRFETNQNHWKSLNILAFIVILLRQL